MIINLLTRITIVIVLLGCCVPCCSQTITNADGSPLTTKYCYKDDSYLLSGNPSGGTFSGCGMYEQNGQWYFNPLTAAQGVTVFPFACSLSYTVNNQSINRSILVYKPVKIEPPLKDSSTCTGGFDLNATMLYAGAYDYSWMPSAPLERPDTSTTAGFINQSTTFVIVATDLTSGCTGSDTVTITKNPIPEVNATPETITVKAREPVQLQATGAEHYYWTPAKWLDNDTIASPEANPRASVTYSVTGMNEYGCTDTASVTIHIIEDMYVPNAFSPNGDGINDVFRVENIGYQGVEFFKVYNRWGSVVYETTDGTKGWDGSYKGQAADVGIYHYLIKLSMLDGNTKIFKGDVTVLR